jgi:hypothetical protein
MSLNMQIQPSSPALAIRTEPQLCYVLMTLDTSATGAEARAVNWAFIADASRSMRIPIISEDQFRYLVRSGGAQEVLVDGVPVWQLTSPVPPEIRDSAPSALEYVIRALHSIVERLDHADRFTLIACAEDAVMLVPGTGGNDRAQLVYGIGKLKGLRLGEETNLARGLELGLDGLIQARTSGMTGAAPQQRRVERLLLLTDGFTQHPDRCLDLARRAAAEGIAVSTLGLGGEFQDDLLTKLADLSGGQAVFLRHAEAIPRAVAAELDAARAVVAHTVALIITLTKGVALRRVTRISPTLTPLEQAAATPNSQTFHLGDLERDTPIQLLLEFLAPPAPKRMPAEGSARMRLAQFHLASDNMLATTHDLVASYTKAPAVTPSPILHAAARANAVRLQRRAMAMIAEGNPQGAAPLLRATAERMRELGENALADAALREAQAIDQTGQTTGVGAKELTYATRRLGEHEV